MGGLGGKKKRPPPNSSSLRLLFVGVSHAPQCAVEKIHSQRDRLLVEAVFGDLWARDTHEFCALEDDKATKATILAESERVANQEAPDSLLIVHVSAHGGAENETSYIVAYDSRDGDSQSFLPFDLLEQQIRLHQHRVAILVTDCCRMGRMGQRRTPDGPNYVHISASSFRTDARDTESGGQFTLLWLRTLVDLALKNPNDCTIQLALKTMDVAMKERSIHWSWHVHNGADAKLAARTPSEMHPVTLDLLQPDPDKQQEFVDRYKLRIRGDVSCVLLRTVFETEKEIDLAVAVHELNSAVMQAVEDAGVPSTEVSLSSVERGSCILLYKVSHKAFANVYHAVRRVTLHDWRLKENSVGCLLSAWGEVSTVDLLDLEQAYRTGESIHGVQLLKFDLVLRRFSTEEDSCEDDEDIEMQEQIQASTARIDKWDLRDSVSSQGVSEEHSTVRDETSTVVSDSECDGFWEVEPLYEYALHAVTLADNQRCASCKENTASQNFAPYCSIECRAMVCRQCGAAHASLLPNLQARSPKGFCTTLCERIWQQLHNRRCLYCDVRYPVPNRHFCSSDCREGYSETPSRCPNCGDEHDPGDSGSFYCSEGCKAAFSFCSGRGMCAEERECGRNPLHPPLPYCSASCKQAGKKSLVKPLTGQFAEIFAAVRNNNVQHIRDLKPGQTILQHVDHEGHVVLHVAVREGHLDMVDVLLTFGADPNALRQPQSLYGTTPLHCAAKLRDTETAKRMVELLKIYGAVEKTDARGLLPRHLVAPSRETELFGPGSYKGEPIDSMSSDLLFFATKRPWPQDRVNLVLPRGVERNAIERLLNDTIPGQHRVRNFRVRSVLRLHHKYRWGIFKRQPGKQVLMFCAIAAALRPLVESGTPIPFRNGHSGGGAAYLTTRSCVAHEQSELSASTTNFIYLCAVCLGGSTERSTRPDEYLVYDARRVYPCYRIEYEAIIAGQAYALPMEVQGKFDNSLFASWSERCKLLRPRRANEVGDFVLGMARRINEEYANKNVMLDGSNTGYINLLKYIFDEMLPRLAGNPNAKEAGQILHRVTRETLKLKTFQGFKDFETYASS
eukprot:TRINITY_DN7808_c0_g1_i1.p1 TRINITY_DN7808_c0_g1~~TRINITY_DN7808_c0_g1_i1.p1  ORF type:complete len:1073 (+),score=110.53 TRINITY_DN7808_c0_g1_i1:914-4132(+)